MGVKRILTINPGSTSTKIAVFDDENVVLKKTISHSAGELAGFKNVRDQMPFRRNTIIETLKTGGISVEDCDAFSGRGGGLNACVGGVYEINDVMLKHVRSGQYGGDHPASLGCLLAHEFAEMAGKRAFIVNPPDTDEFCDEARITGIAGVYRSPSIHALNQKETALRVCKDRGWNYRKVNLIVAHIGGGVSVTAHKQGMMVDSNGIINGEGPMAPTRTGALPVQAVIEILASGEKTCDEIHKMLNGSGGFLSHLGTADVLEIKQRIADGDSYAKLIYNAFCYQIAKEIGAMAAVLHGKADAVILTGGISHDADLIRYLKDSIGFIAPVEERAGEFEMEALAAGAIRVLNGEEQVKDYTGISPFSGFERTAAGK